VEDGPRDLTLVYTPLHGDGNTSVLEVLDRAGFAAPHVVSEQQHPDPDFPTVAFPNPEEPGAMDLAMALASKVGADRVVANDPAAAHRSARSAAAASSPDSAAVTTDSSSARVWVSGSSAAQARARSRRSVPVCDVMTAR